MTFKAFDEGGAGHLAAWLVLNRETDKLDPIGVVVRELADAIRRDDQAEPIERAILFVTEAAFANAVVGPTLAPMLGRSAGSMEQMTVRLAKAMMQGKLPAK